MRSDLVVALALLAAPAFAAPPAVIVDEQNVTRREPPRHGAIGPHPIAHDEVCYVLSGEGEVTSDGKPAKLTPGMAAYLHTGAVAGIRPLGDADLTLIISYPVVTP